MSQSKDEPRRRFGDRFLFLYIDTLAYHLSVSYPRLFSARYSAYLGIATVPATALGMLWWFLFIQKSLIRMVFILVVTVYLSVRLRSLIVLSYVHAKAWAANRLEANSLTKLLVEDGLGEGRIFTEPDFFDLFLPLSLTNSLSRNTQRTKTKTGILFFPGALVEYQAYASIAKRLSDKGIVVVLFNTERYHRLPIPFMGCNMRTVRKAVALLEQKYNLQVQEWSVGGHSLGGFTAQQLVAQEPHFFSNAILWANYQPLALGDTSVNVLVVQATRDGLGETFRQDPERQRFLDSLAAVRGRTHLHDIEGGNHGGFGDYAHQTFPHPDHERTISLEDMHEEIVQVTSDFIFAQSR
jgi:alpha/beta superfamily hydrolase